MLRRLALPLLALAGTMLSAGAAEAKITIPCTGDRIVKVADAGLPRSDGKKVDLGYLFPGCFAAGEWVGWIGTRDSYIPLDAADRATLFRAAGYRTDPAPPSRWDHPWDALFMEILTVVVLGGVFAWQGIGALRGRRQTA